MFVDYYKSLDIEPTATVEEIKKAALGKARYWQTKSNAPNPRKQEQARQEVERITEAQKILLDEAKRASYDAQHKNQPKDQPPAEEQAVPEGDLVAEGWQLLIAGDIYRATQVATQATARQGDNPAAWELLGQLKWHNQELDDAAYEYKRAIGLNPNDPGYHYSLGGIYQDAEKFPEALAALDQALTLAPEETAYQAAKAGLQVQMGDFEPAIPVLEHCVEKNPDEEWYRLMLGHAYLDQAFSKTTHLLPGHTIDEEGYYITSKKQLDAIEAIVDKADRLNITDSVFATRMTEQKKVLADAMKYVFYKDNIWQATLAGGFWGVIITVMSTNTGTMFIVGFVAIVLLHLLVSRAPQYYVNGIVAKQNERAEPETVSTVKFWASVVLQPVLIVKRAVQNYVLAPRG